MPPPKVKPKTKVPARKPRKPAGVTKVGGRPALTVKRVPKNFSIRPWSAAGEGRKVMIYGGSGMGKTTLASLLDKPVFIGTDDGGRLIKNQAGDDLTFVPEIEDFQDVRDVLQSKVFDTPDCSDIVIDTITETNRWAVPYILQNVLKEKKGNAAAEHALHLEDYGWRKGYRHWFEAMELLLSDCNRWVRAGKNIVLLAQETGIKITNEGGDDYRVAGPDLYHDSQVSIMNLVKSWCDHVFRIAYANIQVDKKKARSTGERAIYVHPTINYIAKTRTIPAAWTSVGFADKTDASIWNLLDDPDQECA